MLRATQPNYALSSFSFYTPWPFSAPCPPHATCTTVDADQGGLRSRTDAPSETEWRKPAICRRFICSLCRIVGLLTKGFYVTVTGALASTRCVSRYIKIY